MLLNYCAEAKLHKFRQNYPAYYCLADRFRLAWVPFRQAFFCHEFH
jgi:hypothetical protein